MTDAEIPVDRVGFASVDEEDLRGARFVVLSGADALARFRPDLETRLCHGRAMVMPHEVIGFPVFHPEAFDRNPRWRPLLVEELRLLRQIAMDRARWMCYVPDTCVRCRGEFFRIDWWGVVYCEACVAGIEDLAIAARVRSRLAEDDGTRLSVDEVAAKFGVA